MRMTALTLSRHARTGAGLIVLALIATAQPAAAQSKSQAAEARLQKIESEVKALQRQVFPGGDSKFFPPEISATPGTPANPAGTPATTPVTDLLTRMDSVESQLARLTAQGEENANRIASIEAKLAALSPPPAPPPAAVIVPPPSGTGAALAPGTALAPAKPAATTAAPAKPKPPSSDRLAAVKAVEKPKTADAADDEYSYGYRLWEAKFFPESEQQLQLFLDKFPRHQRVSYARNLMGRALLDEGKPREAAQWFLKNYQGDKKGARAPDSLLFLAESMRRLKDTNRACIALGEFSAGYAEEAAGRLKTQYDATRSGLKCN